MAKDPRATQNEKHPPSEKKPSSTTTITYIPGEHDPVKTKWHGLTWDANVPKEVSREEVIEAARSNPWFKVGEFNPATDKPPQAGFSGTPSTPEQYRAHFVEWLKKIKVANAEGEPNQGALDDLMKRWLSEEHLRQLCDVGPDDIDWMGTLFLPKMYEIAKAAGLTDKQLYEKWRDQYGVTQLPFTA